MITLGVNVDHIATIRQARGTAYPDPLEAAQLAIAGGADQITIHLREDRRHIQDDDLLRMRRELRVPLNLEMAAADAIVAIACEARPATATLVPERREELTTEGGLDVAADAKRLAEVVARLTAAGIAVSLFIDPELTQLEAAAAVRAHAVELHTGAFCDAADARARAQELERLTRASRRAKGMGFKVCAGHGIHYDNAAGLARALPEVTEYNIGHAIVARACSVGMAQAVKEMTGLLNKR
jgi:pyridoxine 5-phosphate synthase